MGNDINLQLYPNPASDVLNANLTLTGSSNVTVEVVDLNGQVIKEVLNATLSGTQQIAVNTSTFSQGMYFLRIASAEGVSTNKFMVVK